MTKFLVIKIIYTEYIQLVDIENDNLQNTNISVTISNICMLIHNEIQVSKTTENYSNLFQNGCRHFAKQFLALSRLGNFFG